MRTAVVMLAFVLAASGCGKGEEAPAPAPSPAPVAPARNAAEPMGAAKVANLTGKVLERLEAATYSYLRLATAGGEVWAAVPATTVEVGAEVTVVDPMAMTNFESKALARTFETVYFGRLEGQAAGAMAAGNGPQGVAVSRGKMAPHGGAMADPHAGMDMGGDQAAGVNDAMAAHGKAAPAAADVQVERAPGGLTVGEIWAQRAELGGKPVTVRGKVVKYNANILGKNWLHLQDGSGDPTSATHDIAVTTADTVAVGDVVTVSGVLGLDQEFGAGYSYAAIIQDARVTK